MSTWTTPVHGRQARRGRRVTSAAASALLIALALAVVRLAQPAAASSSSGANYYYDGTHYYYTLFTAASGAIVDGASGVGNYGVVGNGGAMVGDTIVFADMGGSGSALRQITKDGVLSTIAGSLAAKGYVNGNATATRFGGASSGGDRFNAVVYGNGGYYLADTRNAAVRFTNATTATTTSVVVNPYVSVPTALSVSTSSGVTSVYVSDAGFHQVLFIANLASPTTVLNLTSINQFEPGALAVFSSLSRVFVVDTVLQIYCWDYQVSDSTPWNVSNPTSASFRRILTPSSDGTKLLYVSSDTTISSLDATATQTASLSLVPQTVLSLNTNLIGGTIRLFFQRSSDSWYILSETKYMIVSTSPVDLSSSSSSSGTTTTTQTPSDSSDSEFAGRHLGIAAFPTAAFPTNDSCLMSQLYYWMRVDATTVYKTNDYINEFLIAPANTTKTYVRGSANVSTWCGNITTPKNNDGTLSILDFWGPTAYEMWYMQSQLASSPWTNTRAFLATLQSEGWTLGSFCFINCSTTCATITAPKCPSEASCDGVCKGAIASSVVMGAAGIVLIVLMIVSPANIFTAIMMVPII